MKKLKWDKRFINLAKHISEWSLDPRAKVGAVIVDSENRIVSTGYNGFPRGIADTEERLNNREVKLDLVIHAELNCLLFSNQNLMGCTLYIWPMPPCIRCAVHIVQSKVSRVVSPTCKREHWIESSQKAIDILNEAGIIVEHCEGDESE